jgi:hypothetical protein
VAAQVGQRDGPAAAAERARDVEVAPAVLAGVVHDRHRAARLARRGELEHVQQHQAAELVRQPARPRRSAVDSRSSR